MCRGNFYLYTIYSYILSFKINTLGEEAFLDKLIELLDV